MGRTIALPLPFNGPRTRAQTIVTVDARAIDVPKPTDFHPDPKVTRARSLSPAIAYPTKAEVAASLRDASFHIAKRGVSNNTRAKFQRIIAKRQKQLEKRLYREAIAELEKNATLNPGATADPIIS